jgi:membrane protein YqaA with SNARE-associated domain
MGRFVDRVRALALSWGAPGVFLVAFLDSSFLPLPGITDLLLIVMITQHPHLVLLYVLGGVTGSVAGCLVMHAIGRKGGETFARTRFSGPRIEQATATLQRHGIMAVLIPSLLPPPAPFKIFVLLAGVAGISAAKFATAIAIGRTIRYGVLGWLAVRYGSQASFYLAEHGTAMSITLAGVLGAGLATWLVWNKLRTAKSR